MRGDREGGNILSGSDVLLVWKPIGECDSTMKMVYVVWVLGCVCEAVVWGVFVWLSIGVYDGCGLGDVCVVVNKSGIVAPPTLSLHRAALHLVYENHSGHYMFFSLVIKLLLVLLASEWGLRTEEREGGVSEKGMEELSL